MKKKLALMLTILLSICMLTACGEDPKTVDYNGKSYDDISNEAVTNAYYISYMSQFLTEIELTEQDKEALHERGFTDAQLEASVVWADIESKYGHNTQFEDKNFTLESFDTTDIFTIDKAGNTLTADLTLVFGDKDVIFEVVYDYYDMSITSISMNPVQTLTEKMVSAGQNTIISLAIVFFVLILISLVIKGFVIFPMIEEKKKNKAKNNSQDASVIAEAPVADVTNVETTNVDDSELIAVIAAAIAASEGTSTSDFVVRSINRR